MKLTINAKVAFLAFDHKFFSKGWFIQEIVKLSNRLFSSEQQNIVGRNLVHCLIYVDKSVIDVHLGRNPETVFEPVDNLQDYVRVSYPDCLFMIDNDLVIHIDSEREPYRYQSFINLFGFRTNEYSNGLQWLFNRFRKNYSPINLCTAPAVKLLEDVVLLGHKGTFRYTDTVHDIYIKLEKLCE